MTVADKIGELAGGWAFKTHRVDVLQALRLGRHGLDDLGRSVAEARHADA